MRRRGNQEGLCTHDQSLPAPTRLESPDGRRTGWRPRRQRRGGLRRRQEVTLGPRMKLGRPIDQAANRNPDTGFGHRELPNPCADGPIRSESRVRNPMVGRPHPGFESLISPPPPSALTLNAQIAPRSWQGQGCSLSPEPPAPGGAGTGGVLEREALPTRHATQAGPTLGPRRRVRLRPRSGRQDPPGRAMGWRVVYPDAGAWRLSPGGRGHG